MANKIPEFDLFKRIENLEEKTKGKLTFVDTSIMATMGLMLAWAAFSMHAPEYARKLKDNTLKGLKTAGLNKEALDVLEKLMSEQCDLWESL